MSLEENRRQIDTIDDEIITLLKRRFALVLKLSSEKTRLTDSERENEILSKIDSGYIQNISKLNQSPEKEGWLYKIKLSNLSELEGLLDKAVFKENK